MRHSFFGLVGLALATPGCLDCDSSERDVKLSDDDYATLFATRKNPLPYEVCEEHCGEFPPGQGEVDCALDTEKRVLACSFYEECDSGRRPHRLLPRRTRMPRSVAGWFAEVAHLEAASVVAFGDLALELAAHGMPQRLVRAAVASARDEARHARVMGALAREHGALPERVRVAPLELRSLEAIALHNAAEGCVGETLAARLLDEQARRAREPRLGGVFARIGREEARHGALSRALDRALAPRLPAIARRRVAEAKERALAERARMHEREPEAAVRDTLGMPSAERAQTLCGALRREVLG
jgi:hypothetical protein